MPAHSIVSTLSTRRSGLALLENWNGGGGCQWVFEKPKDRFKLTFSVTGTVPSRRGFSTYLPFIGMSECSLQLRKITPTMLSTGLAILTAGPDLQIAVFFSELKISPSHGSIAKGASDHFTRDQRTDIKISTRVFLTGSRGKLIHWMSSAGMPWHWHGWNQLGKEVRDVISSDLTDQDGRTFFGDISVINTHTEYRITLLKRRTFLLLRAWSSFLWCLVNYCRGMNCILSNWLVKPTTSRYAVLPCVPGRTLILWKFSTGSSMWIVSGVCQPMLPFKLKSLRRQWAQWRFWYVSYV